jgi:hypothetical protein
MVTIATVSHFSLIVSKITDIGANRNEKSRPGEPPANSSEA